MTREDPEGEWKRWLTQSLNLVAAEKTMEAREYMIDRIYSQIDNDKSLDEHGRAIRRKELG